MIREIHIYDLDGTVIDSSHRYRTIRDANGTLRIDLDYWRANQCRALEDSLLPLADQMLAQLHDASMAVFVATARVMGPHDWLFMHKHFPVSRFAGFFHRPANNTEKGAILKTKQLQAGIIRNNLEHVSLRWFYEDNLEYLHYVSFEIGAVPVYIPSTQGY